MDACVLGCFKVVKYVFLCVGSTRITPIFLFDLIFILARFLTIDCAVAPFSFYLCHETPVVLTNIFIAVVTFTITTFVTVHVLTYDNSVTI